LLRREPCEGKLSRRVLRGERGGKAPALPGHGGSMKRIIWLALMFGFIPSLFIEYLLRKMKKLEKLNRTLKS